MASLPTKLDLAAVFGDSYQDSNATAESFTDKDVTVKQLAKDMSRDRVVIQGACALPCSVSPYLTSYLLDSLALPCFALPGLVVRLFC